ncbi:hypothetical protein N5C97_08670 [Acinetobacter johnsonii]|uniref:Uncharacterized protein n=1 Tax=Acinetobacter johnsonii TaxID=40214 RepID=A0AA42MA47_ACIJO|nr:hypothetical protein [Acinetobacter johnsonii]MDH0826572.1 hypothetical protein [Acinetobacter johnsonii]
MPDIQVLTLDKVGGGLIIEPNTGELEVLVSKDPRNILKVNTTTKELFVNGYSVDVIPSENSIIWINVDILDLNIKSGMSDSSNPLQVGKDLLGNIWVRGALTNIGSALPANSIVAKIPVDCELSNYPNSYDFFQLTAIQSSLAGNSTALFLRFRDYDYQQSIAFSGNWATNVSFMINPTIIGKARYEFQGSVNGSIPNYTNATWEPVQITNANVINGLADGSYPMSVGRDADGNLWLRGAVTNNGTAVSANGVIGIIPLDYQLSGYPSVNSFIQLVAIQSLLAGNTASLFFRLKSYNNIQSFAFSGSLATGVSFMIQPTIIGRAKTPL